MQAARNLRRPAADQQLGGRAADTVSAVGRVAAALAHPVRRWALEHVMEHGQVTSRDVTRQHPYLEESPGLVSNLLRPLLTHGYLRVQERRRGTAQPHVYLPGDLSDFRELHTLLGGLLASPHLSEVTHEAHE